MLNNFTTYVALYLVFCILRDLWRMFHPFRCACGYVTFLAHSMFKHLAIKHGYKE